MRIEWLSRCLGSKWGLRAAAVGAAVTVWYAVELATGNNATVGGVPLTVVAPPGWTVTETGASQVTVHFRGTRDETRLLDRETVRATLEVPGAGAEEGAVLSLGARQISAPGGARVVRVEPPRVRVKTDREETRQVPVELATRNSLPEGYVGGAATITPASVEVTGPAGVVGNLRSVKTAELELDGRTTPVKGRKMALATGGAMSILRVTPREVTVDMGVTEETRERVFEHLPVRVLVASGSGAAGRVEPETATVTVKGRPDALKRVTADNLQVFVDASGAGAADGTLRRAVQVYAPAGVGVSGTEPATATVIPAEGAGGAE